MKFLLTLILCSYTESTCMPAYKWPETFDAPYDCMIFGYEESIKKMKEIGREDANRHQIYIRFTCTPVDSNPV